MSRPKAGRIYTGETTRPGRQTPRTTHWRPRSPCPGGPIWKYEKRLAAGRGPSGSASEVDGQPAGDGPCRQVCFMPLAKKAVQERARRAPRTSLWKKSPVTRANARPTTPRPPPYPGSFPARKSHNLRPGLRPKPRSQMPVATASDVGGTFGASIEKRPLFRDAIGYCRGQGTVCRTAPRSCVVAGSGP